MKILEALPVVNENLPDEARPSYKHSALAEEMQIRYDLKRKLHDDILKEGKCPGCEKGGVRRTMEVPREMPSQNRIMVEIEIDCPLFELGKCEYGVAVKEGVALKIEAELMKQGVPKRHVVSMRNIRKSHPVYRKATEWDCRGFLLLCGSVGIGKSFSAACVLRKWIGNQLTGKDVDFYTSPALEGTIHAKAMAISWKRAFEMCDDRECRQKARTVPFLVIDELGAESLNDYSAAILGDLISARYDGDLSTIVTTNLTPEALCERYGERMMDRLNGETGKIIVVDGMNMRRPSHE